MPIQRQSIAHPIQIQGKSIAHTLLNQCQSNANPLQIYANRCNSNTTPPRIQCKSSAFSTFSVSQRNFLFEFFLTHDASTLTLRHHRAPRRQLSARRLCISLVQSLPPHYATKVEHGNSRAIQCQSNENPWPTLCQSVQIHGQSIAIPMQIQFKSNTNQMHIHCKCF